MELKIQDGVVEIAEYAYRGRTDIEKVVFPPSVKNIGNAAFAKCTNLKELCFNEGLERIGGSAFEGCCQLASIVFPQGIVEIGVCAFMGCVALKNLTIPGSVKVFKMAAFRDCSGLAKVVIEKGVSDIPSKAFINCKRLAQVEIPSSVTSIGDLAFKGCVAEVASRRPEPIVMSKKVGWQGWKNSWIGFGWTCEVERYPQWYAHGIMEGVFCIIDLSSGAESMSYPYEMTDESPISGWTDEYKTDKLVLRRIPRGVFSMGTPALECNLPHKVELTFDYYIGLFPVTQRQYELVMGKNPSHFLGGGRAPVRPVECVSYYDIRGEQRGSFWPNAACVDRNSFLGRIRARTGLFNLDIPTAAQWERACRGPQDEDGRKSDDVWCRSNSRGYTRAVGLGRQNGFGLHDMCGNVWEWCLDRFSSMVRHNELTTNPSGVDVRFSILHELRGGGVNVKQENCTAHNRGFASPCQSYNFTGFRLALTMGDRKLDPNLAQVPKILRAEQWQDVDSIDDLQIPEGVEELEEGLLMGVGNLKSVKLPKSLREIGANCFKGCVGLKSIEIPEGVSRIGEGAFDGCVALESVRLPTTVDALKENCFASCDSLISIDIPEGVAVLNGSVFCNCKNLRAVILPRSLKAIVGRFGGIDLDYSDSDLFTGCASLREVVFREGLLRVASNVFGLDNSIERIVLPKSVTHLSPKFLNDKVQNVEVVCEWEGRDWTTIKSYSWVAILMYHPEFAERCPAWGSFDDRDWEMLLKRQPQFAGRRVVKS